MSNCIRVTELIADSGEVSAIATQRLPYPCQRAGLSGLIQRPDDHSANLLSLVYGIFGEMPSGDNRPAPAAIAPLPTDSPIDDYTQEFRRLCGLFANRNRWKVSRQCPHVDVDDLAQDAVLLMLSDPERYATEPLEAGASAAVNDAVRNAQGGTARRELRLTGIVGDTIPEPVRPEPLDYESEADRLIPLVGRPLSLPAALVASDAEYGAAWEAIGISKSAFYVRRGKIVERLYSLAFPVQNESERADR